MAVKEADVLSAVFGKDELGFPLRKEEWFSFFHPDCMGDRRGSLTSGKCSRGRLVLEIGYGGGEYIKRRAQASPEDLFVGIEKEKVMYLRALQRIKKVSNVVLVQQNALEVLPFLFAPSSVDEVVINFPDPWPKRRHRKHRLFQWMLVEDLRWIMVPGGVLRLASDQRDYIEWAAYLLFSDFASYFKPVFPAFYLKDPSFKIGTRYESKWREEGRSIYYLEALRI